ncbi:hypothetical protein Ssi03_22900 [Sphaerisporangium siamense]|uniref:Tetratricopeptide (TPR) repeat protein n=1 Tax=Sphaerisporangium siamense TaxID=795645 RepID=A0A7W7D857_9ACTN|nr:hypothetical protein [Sphaerisporangium siamense]MBB4701794.1 tetratricopeptide (TPR) repeat protein [Sphaerisporangium siamense]GII84300.1 hypothetical protein Ssi03_22900 [Sphaerisporangium siamense]
MEMDPANVVVRLCTEGMRAEAEGRPEDARRLFDQAWAERSDDFDACVAAHYVARQQDSPEEVLLWNAVALHHAKEAGDERVAGFFPSLYLNMGASHELLGDPAEAERYFRLAEDHAPALPPGPYGDMLRQGIVDGLARVRG